MSSAQKIKRVLVVGREEDSGLSSFVERPVPSEKQVASFERIVGREVHEQEIDSNLSEIYQDKNGQKINVQKMTVKKKPLFLVRLFRKLLIFGFLALAIFLVYFKWFSGQSDISSLDFKISAPEKIVAGEEFSYQVDYHNPTGYPLSKLWLEVQYPENFIFTSSTIAPKSGNYGWDLPDLASGGNASLTITGKLIAPPDSANIIIGHLSYQPGSFTSQFKKDASASTIVSGLGFSVDLDYSATAFLDQDNEMTLIFSDVQDNHLGDFNISFTLPTEANASVIVTGAGTSTPTVIGTSASTSPPLAAKKITVTKNGGASWQVSGLSQELGRQEIPLTYKIKQKSNNLEIKVRLEKKMENGQSYVFWEKAIKPELVNSDLNLTILLNGSKNDGAITFGQPLNYSLTYSNRGLNTFKDIVIMAALSGNFLDWNSLKDENKGEVNNKTVIWTEKEIPGLAEIKPGAEGAIDFRINLLPFKDGDLGQNLVIISYGQYGMNNKPVQGDNNKSNTIISKINSDLSLSEQILYFNSDNLPVGSGPLPPQVGQKTSFKVYWTVKNNLHELTDARVIFTLPSGVAWDNNNTTNVGNLYYDEASRQVIWEIGRLPVSVYRVDAEFNLSVTPLESDRNKILVISSGSTVSAMDTETKDTITKRLDAKTTKLEDDDIAGLNNSGIVQ
jgi:hypothetical protein